MTTLLIVLSASGWTAAVWLLATRRATTRIEPARILRPDFGLFADDADRAGMPSSAALYRSMSDAWPHDEPATPALVREDPGENRAGAPNIDREDVERLHGVYCYRDLNQALGRAQVQPLRQLRARQRAPAVRVLHLPPRRVALVPGAEGR